MSNKYGMINRESRKSALFFFFFFFPRHSFRKQNVTTEIYQERAGRKKKKVCLRAPFIRSDQNFKRVPRLPSRAPSRSVFYFYFSRCFIDGFLDVSGNPEVKLFELWRVTVRRAERERHPYKTIASSVSSSFKTFFFLYEFILLSEHISFV